MQRTEILTITVPDLIPGSGLAAVDYVFGYSSKRLIEVNVTWSTHIDPANTPANLLRTGVTLQNYFQGAGFAANHVATNAVLGNGRLLLFRASDAGGHGVILTLAGPVSLDSAKHARVTPAVLSLAYAANPSHPDVFALQNGSF